MSPQQIHTLLNELTDLQAKNDCANPEHLDAYRSGYYGFWLSYLIKDNPAQLEILEQLIAKQKEKLNANR